MKIGILQPGYLPWLGFFEQMYHTDIFVIYDDVAFDKGGWRNRNRIKTPGGWSWLTVPVIRENLLSTSIRDVRINNSTDWRKKHFSTLCQNYAKAPCFSQVFPVLEEAYATPWEKLIDIDMYFIRAIMKILGLKREIFLSSGLGIEGDRNERLVEICRHFGADCFYEGKAGECYIDHRLFAENHIQVIFQDYRHPVYPQLHGEFIPYMSVIDLLFNCGEKSLSIITSSAGPSGAAGT